MKSSRVRGPIALAPSLALLTSRNETTKPENNMFRNNGTTFRDTRVTLHVDRTQSHSIAQYHPFNHRSTSTLSFRVRVAAEAEDASECRKDRTEAVAVASTSNCGLKSSSAAEQRTNDDDIYQRVIVLRGLDSLTRSVVASLQVNEKTNSGRDR